MFTFSFFLYMYMVIYILSVMFNYYVLFAISLAVTGMLCYVTSDILKKRKKECHYCYFFLLMKGSFT